MGEAHSTHFPEGQSEAQGRVCLWGVSLQTLSASLPGLCPTLSHSHLWVSYLYLSVSVSTIMALLTTIIIAITAYTLHHSLFRALHMLYSLNPHHSPRNPVYR